MPGTPRFQTILLNTIDTGSRLVPVHALPRFGAHSSTVPGTISDK